MITQVFYNKTNGFNYVWQTTYSDKNYSPDSRKHMFTSVKPTERQVRHLHKQKGKWSKS